MTNLPRNRLRLLNGHGAPPPVAPVIVPQRVPFDPVMVADRIGGSVQVGAPFTIAAQASGQPVLVALPDFGELHARVGASITPPLTDDNVDHLALIGALADYQRVTAAIFARWKARHAPAPKPDDPLDKFIDEAQP